jgi:zinc resistance-associated protein
MWKTVLAGTTALAIAGTTLAYAQQGWRGHDRMPHWRPSAADITAFGDGRIAALRAGLELTADQQKLWPPVESALRDVFKQRSDWFTARADADRPADPVERLNTRAQAMLDRGSALKKLADAADPLYKSLDDAQKHRFTVLARFDGGHGFGGHEHRGWQHRGEGGGHGDSDRKGPQPL